MRRILFFLLTLLPLAAATAAEGATAFVDVGVFHPGDDRVTNHQTVIVERDLITHVGDRESVSVPDGARVIDGEGRYLMPGLAEMHAHIPGRDAGEQYVKDVLFLFVANGITTIRGMLGEPWHLELRQQVADGEVTGPRIFTSGPSFNGNTVTSPAQAAEKVRTQKGAGYDFLKLHPGLTAAEFEAFAGAARAVNIPFAGHISRDAGLKATLAAGQATIDHLEGFIAALVPPGKREEAGDPGFFGLGVAAHADPERIDGVARAAAASDTWLVPTDALLAHVAGEESTDELLGRPEMRYVSAEQREGWRNRREQFAGERDPESAKRYLELRLQLIRALDEAGAGLLLGSDAPQVFNVPGYSIHHELDRLVEAGLTPSRALATGTTNVARFYDAGEWFGAVREGLSADLVLLDGNPRESVDAVQRPAGVMLRGEWFDRDALDERLEAIARRAGNG